jgi:hypothetical protein
MGKGLNPTSLSFCHSNERWKYLQVLTGFGSTIPAVYIACHVPSILHLLVISLISTGVSLFDRSFLCIQRKLTSEAFRTFFRTRIAIGTAEMNATNFRDVVARTPTCHSFVHPGARRALDMSVFNQSLGPRYLPFEECLGIVESEHSLIILNIMPVKQFIHFLYFPVICKIHSNPFKPIH